MRDYSHSPISYVFNYILFVERGFFKSLSSFYLASLKTWILAYFIHQHLSISFQRENMVNKVMNQNIECAKDNQIVKCYEKKTREYLNNEIHQQCVRYNYTF